jgi:hypothetical protein
VTARLLTLSDADYFADNVLPETPTLSQSIAKLIVDKSPLHAWASHPRLGNCADRESTKALDDGTLMHHMLLGTGDGNVEIIAADNYRTKVAQEARDLAIAAGKLPVLAHLHAALTAGVSMMRDRMADAGVDMDLFDAAQAEAGILWYEGDVACRGRMDKLHVDRRIIFDVKKSSSAHPLACARHMLAYGYDIQHTAYTSALEALTGAHGEVDMQFIFIEDKAPYAVTVGRPDGIMRELGARKWKQAVATWKACLASGKWPGYATGPVNLEAPAWAISQQMVAEMEDEDEDQG